MQFNSLEFAGFLSVVFLLYWFVFKKLKWQNLLLLISSYVFYGWWDYRFLFLLAFSTLLDYFTGLKIFKSKSTGEKKIWLWISIIINIGFLAVFKYYNFFVASFADLLSQFGFKTNFWSLNIVLPIGISFYTFHGLSYILDIYRNKIKPERNWISYAAFISFFPLLVAGPIERATHLLPQIVKERHFDYHKAIDGLRQILWGLCKKIIIADTCAEFVNTIFDNPSYYSGSTLALGAVFFSIQIYGDFSGYSDIAIGTGKLFGIDLMRNFSFPYFSRNIAEFWRRWHISLTTWFRDYLYIPLGGSQNGIVKTVRNVFVVFLVSALWHGANWTFIAWGLLHAIYFLPLLLLKKNRIHLDIIAQGRYLPSLKELLSMIITFGLVTFAWIFFRAESMGHAIQYINGIFSYSFFTLPGFIPKRFWVFLVLFFLVEWHGREQQYALAHIGIRWPRTIRWILYSLIVLVIFHYSGTEQPFIYFQF